MRLLVAVWLALGLRAQDPRTLRPQQEPVQPAVRESRIALVIGNGAYKEVPLKNPVHDAQAMAQALQGCGFQVQVLVDASLPQMDAALRVFGQRLRAGGVGLFFYAGHGMQVKGTNYLIPVGADIGDEDEIRFKALDANAVLAKMESAGNGLNLMVLDACRNNPFGRGWRRGGAEGLALLSSEAVSATCPSPLSDRARMAAVCSPVSRRSTGVEREGGTGERLGVDGGAAMATIDTARAQDTGQRKRAMVHHPSGPGTGMRLSPPGRRSFRQGSRSIRVGGPHPAKSLLGGFIPWCRALPVSPP